MQYKYKNISINYVYYDNKSDDTLIYLHGWGQNIQMMEPIAKPFIKTKNVLILDLPGFGSSDEPNTVWTIFDYADMVNSIVNDFKCKNVSLIGHSFGGKISIAYASKYKTKKIVLLASPFEASKSDNSLKTKVLKSMKKVPGLNKLAEVAKKYIGSTDYKNASEMMRNILVKHVNTDLCEDAKKIKCPTLLIWGTQDAAVSYESALKLEKLISNCGLVTYDGCTHYAYLERLDQTKNVLKHFFNEGSDK